MKLGEGRTTLHYTLLHYAASTHPPSALLDPVGGGGATDRHAHVCRGGEHLLSRGSPPSLSLLSISLTILSLSLSLLLFFFNFSVVSVVSVGYKKDFTECVGI